uniref:Uncharacterized protein n=1 Tax=Siphoviridae sp. ct7es18 TaxID=2826166 RepID=A0A8S5MH44_9CAUD|nr:MAG TPA: hypothetical protein [Siphoviridae sp. ct7es18]
MRGAWIEIGEPHNGKIKAPRGAGRRALMCHFCLWGAGRNILGNFPELSLKLRHMHTNQAGYLSVAAAVVILGNVVQLVQQISVYADDKTGLRHRPRLLPLFLPLSSRGARVEILDFILLG